jgi:hypothetical protein
MATKQGVARKNGPDLANVTGCPNGPAKAALPRADRSPKLIAAPASGNRAVRWPDCQNELANQRADDLRQVNSRLVATNNLFAIANPSAVLMNRNHGL